MCPFCITSIALVTACGGTVGGVASLILKPLIPVSHGNVRPDESKTKSLQRRKSGMKAIARRASYRAPNGKLPMTDCSRRKRPPRMRVTHWLRNDADCLGSG